MNKDILEMLEKKQFSEIKATIKQMHPQDISSIITTLPSHFQGIVYRLLPKDVAVNVFENFEIPFQETLLNSLKSDEVIGILNEMAPDDRTRLFEELPANIVLKYLALLDESKRKIAYNLLGYKEDTAGRLMTTDFLELQENFTISQAIETIRITAPKKETIYYGYVISPDRKLNGVISLKSIITSEPDDV
ncbi:MAG: CBS domain-containing protein, partial [Firmicutes bacterium]|nr:CBS domain-containing protein [Bacillota bacterium]